MFGPERVVSHLELPAPTGSDESGRRQTGEVTHLPSEVRLIGEPAGQGQSRQGVRAVGPEPTDRSLEPEDAGEGVRRQTGRRPQVSVQGPLAHARSAGDPSGSDLLRPVPGQQTHCSAGASAASPVARADGAEPPARSYCCPDLCARGPGIGINAH
jgi:hypothetical protein